MKELYFEPHGISYRVNDFEPERQTIVFIHGLTGSSSAWLEYEKLFDNSFNLLTLDLPGHGLSRKSVEYESYSIHAQARAIFELLNHVGIKRFALLSHSFGTLMALEIMLAHMEQVLWSIFLSPVYDINSAKGSRFNRSLAFIAATCVKLFPYWGKVRGRTDYSRHKNTGDWNLYRMYDDLRNTTLRVYFFCLSQIYSFDETGKWERVKVPALIMHGTLDSLVPVEHARRLHEVMRYSELIVLDGTDHLIILNNVSEVSQAIEGFMKHIPRDNMR